MPSSPRHRSASAPPGERRLPEQFEASAGATLLVKDAEGFGSGFYLSPDGLVLTAAHVVSRGTVELRNRAGATFTGRVVRMSRQYDVALIALPSPAAAPLPCLAIEATPPVAGIDVFAIGSPASQDLAFSLTRGIVSGLRSVGGVKLIQTDVSLSPGNSGGPLLTNAGRVVGVVSRKLAGDAVEGVGFAVDIGDALSALKLQSGLETSPSLLTGGSVPVSAPRPSKPTEDVDDPVPTLDPERERLEREAQDYERRVRQRDAATPAYVAPLRWGGLALAVAGGIGILYTGTEGTKEITHAEFDSYRLQNDLSWVALVLGSGAFIASFPLQPGLPPPASRRSARARWQLLAGPASVQMKVGF